MLDALAGNSHPVTAYLHLYVPKSGPGSASPGFSVYSIEHFSSSVTVQKHSVLYITLLERLASAELWAYSVLWTKANKSCFILLVTAS